MVRDIPITVVPQVSQAVGLYVHPPVTFLQAVEIWLCLGPRYEPLAKRSFPAEKP